MPHNQLPELGKMMLRLYAIIFFVCSYLVGMSQTVTGWQLTGNRNADQKSVSFVGTTDGVPLRFGTKNTIKMLIDSVGRVGVGNLTPAYTLDVLGQLRLNNGTQGAGKVLTSDASGVATWLTPASNPWATSGNNLYNINTGRIGIGTVAPNALLDVNGDILVNGIRIGRGTSLFNTILGGLAMPANTTGINNTAIGYSALNVNTTGLNNTALGAYALSKNVAGFENTAIGNEALERNTNGKYNTATGHMALTTNLAGSRNSAFGDSALFSNAGGSSNSAVGALALLRNIGGIYNTAVGQQALEFNKSGTYNTAIGYMAGSTGTDSAILTNATAIGANAKVRTNNSLVLGNNANIGIGTSSPTAKLEVVGQIKIVDGTSNLLNKVLTSDANGLAKWKVAPSAHWLANGNDIYNYNFSTGGNVAIGTNSSPYARLEVNNTMKFTNTSTDQNDGIIGTAPYVPGLNIVGINTDNTARKISFWGGLQQQENISGNYLVGNTNFPNGIWDENGRLGIGTSAPLEYLDINGNLNFSNSILPVNIINEVGGTDPVMNLGVNFRGSNVNQAYRGGAYRIDSRDGLPLHNWFARLPNSANEDILMALRENGGLSIGSTFTGYSAPDNGAIIQGNVGIGKTIPGWKLDVTGDVMADGGWLRATGDNGLFFQNWGGGWNMSDATWIRAYNNKQVWVENVLGTGNGLTVGYSGTTPPFGGAIIAGTVGIGKATPNISNYKLDVYTTEWDAISAITDKSGRNAINGRANIGTSAYGIYGESSSGYAGYFSGKVNVTGTFTNPSDVRLKENIKPIENALSLLTKLEAKTYNFKKEYSKMNLPEGSQFGLIAQDVEKIIPSLVSVNYDKSMDEEHPFAYKAINYIGLIPLLTEAVKEQQKIIDDQAKTIEAQQKDIIAIKRKLGMQ